MHCYLGGACCFTGRSVGLMVASVSYAAESLTLQQAIDMALRNNPSIRLADAQFAPAIKMLVNYGLTEGCNVGLQEEVTAFGKHSTRTKTSGTSIKEERLLLTL